MRPQSPPLTIGGLALKEYDDLDNILGLTFDSKITFRTHRRSVSRSACQRLSILRMSWRVFNDRLLLERYFQGFILEYCAAVWCSAGDADAYETTELCCLQCHFFNRGCAQVYPIKNLGRTSIDVFKATLQICKQCNNNCTTFE